MSNNKKPTVILLSGKSGSGKDYIANIMKQQLEDKGNKVLITHYADLLKYILKTFFNWDGQKDEKGRTLLQHVGTDVIRKQNPDYWVNFINGIICYFHDEWDYILIPDARFPNEIDAIKRNSYVDTITVRINRTDTHLILLTLEQTQHKSETALDNYSFDYYLNNNGTETGAEEQVKTFLSVINNDKRKCFIDMDLTLFNTPKAITEMYDEDFQYYSDYKKIPWEEVRSWEFSELSAASSEYINMYFNQKRFFDKVEMYPDAKEVIDKLSKKYKIVFVSHGYSPNLRLKQEYIKKHFPYAEFIGVNLKEYKDKACVDMTNGVFIDDTPDNLNSSNAEIKICYGDYIYNKNFDTSKPNCFKKYSWRKVGDMLL